MQQPRSVYRCHYTQHDALHDHTAETTRGNQQTILIYSRPYKRNRKAVNVIQESDKKHAGNVRRRRSMLVIIMNRYNKKGCSHFVSQKKSKNTPTGKAQMGQRQQGPIIYTSHNCLGLPSLFHKLP